MNWTELIKNFLTREEKTPMEAAIAAAELGIDFNEALFFAEEYQQELEYVGSQLCRDQLYHDTYVGELYY